MAFEWKAHKDIFKGPGIYHLTFAVAGRRPLLGELVAEYPDVTRPFYRNLTRRVPAVNELGALAMVRLSPFGKAVSADLNALKERYKGSITLCRKILMPDHLHVVVWVKADLGVSIRQIAQGFRIGVRKIAEEMGLWQREEGHILEMPYIRTLAHKGQLSRMVRYVHANPDNAWMRKLHPDLYTIRRSRVIAGLRFDTMGKERLLDYPDTSVIALPRALNPEQIAAAVQQALWDAQRGCVTYTAAINAGEKAVARAIREAGYPLVVMLLDGFPAEGTEAARFFHPGMAYHQACGEGRLFLMAPHPDNYLNPELMARTEAAIKAKDEGKGYAYRPLPHESKRWRMMAGNVMLEMISENLAAIS